MNKLKFFIYLVVVALLIFLLRKMNFKQIIFILQKIDLTIFLLAFFLSMISFLIFNLRSVFAVQKIVKVDFLFSLKTIMAGFFVNTITPGAQLGGDPVRAYFLGKKYRKSKTKIFGTILADRFYHSLVSAFFVVASIFFIIRRFEISLELKAILEAAIFFLVLTFGITFFLNLFLKEKKIIKIFEKLNKFVFRKKKGKLKEILDNHLGNFARIFKKTLTNPNFILIAISLSLVYWILNYLISYLIFLSLGVDIKFFIVVVVASFAELVGDFSPSPGGFGFVEGAMIIIYSLLGIELSLAVVSILVYRFLFYFFALIIGGLSLIHLERSVKD